MQSNFFRAPSIPKLGTRRVSSSIFGGGRRSSTPKLNVRNFSFGGEEDFYKSAKNIESALKEIAGVVNKSTVKIDTLESKVNNFDSILSSNIGIDDNNITKTLVETNKILVEIQKQLSADFALRIADEKEAIKRAKAAESKRKFAAKEKSVEGIKKFGSFAENIVDRVTAPIKSVFDRIKEFFGLILTGIVTNAVFTWLGDPENRKKLNTIFDWVGKIFVGLLLGVITAKFIKWGNRLFKLVRFFWRLPGRLLNVVKGLSKLPGKILRALGLKPRGPSVGQELGKGLEAATSALTPAQEEAKRKLAQEVADRGLKSKGAIIGGKYISVTAEESAKLLKKPNLLQKGMQAVNGFFRGLTGKIAEPVVNLVLPKLPAPAKKKVASIIASKGVKRFLPFVNTVFASIEAINRLMEGDIEGALLSAASAIPVAGWLALILDIWRSAAPDHYQKNVRFGLSSEEIDQAIVEGFNNIGSGRKSLSFTAMSAGAAGGFSRGGTIKASNGMTVPGRGSKNVDSVNALLAPGEEVIRATSAMMYRPLLKDINDNAGRLWDSFSRAIGKLASVSEYQKEVSKEYSKVIKDFDEYLKQEINKKKTKTPSGGGGTRRPKISTEKVKQQPQINTKVSFSSQQTNVRISSSPKITNVNMTPPPSSGGGMTFLPMVLPTQKSKPPQIPTPQNTATDVPFITSVNMSNPYMQLTPEMYGIFV